MLSGISAESHLLSCISAKSRVLSGTDWRNYRKSRTVWHKCKKSRTVWHKCEKSRAMLAGIPKGPVVSGIRQKSHALLAQMPPTGQKVPHCPALDRKVPHCWPKCPQPASSDAPASPLVKPNSTRLFGQGCWKVTLQAKQYERKRV